MILSHEDLFFIQRDAADGAQVSSGSPALRTVSISDNGATAYLAFPSRELAQLYIDTDAATGVSPVQGAPVAERLGLNFSNAGLLLLASEAEVRRFVAAPGQFGFAGHLHHYEEAAGGAGAEGWHPGPAPASIAGEANRWGLWPEAVRGTPVSLQQAVRYFCVQFNPLYFISAFCVLYGVFLVARNIDQLGLHSPEAEQLVLFGVIQAYEALVIAGAAFLVHRAGAVRPAVLLGFLECVLLFDCTFRLESAAVQGIFGAAITVLWLLLTAVKLWALGRALRLTMERAHFAALIATALGMVGCITWLSAAGSNKALAFQVGAWFGTFVILMLESRRAPLGSRLARNEREGRIAGRCIRGAFRLFIGFYFYHLWAYVALSGDSAVTAVAVPAQLSAVFLLYTLLRDKELDTWRFGLLTLVTAAPLAAGLTPALVMVGLIFGWRARVPERGRLALGAVFFFYAAAWLAGWTTWHDPMPALPGVLSWNTLALVAALVLIGWLRRDFIAWALLAAGAAYGAYTHLSVGQLVPQSELGRGLLFLGAGFAAMIAGLGVNWYFRTERGAEPSK